MRRPTTPPKLHTWRLSDGYVLRGRVWPPRTPRAPCAFLYVHGIQSHGGWFEWSASVLAESGAPVILPDRRGSGLNEAARGDTPSAERWLADLDELADWAARELGIARCAVVGVSWGGKLAATWSLRTAARVTRVLLIAPGLFPAVDLGLLAKLRVGLSLLAGGDGRFEIPLNDPALFTDNPVGRQFIAADPLKLARVTARFLWASRRLDRCLQRLAPRSFVTPVTLVLPGRDQIIRNGPTECWLRRVSAQPPEIRRLTNAAHTPEFEPDVGQFAELLREFAAVE